MTWILRSLFRPVLVVAASLVAVVASFGATVTASISLTATALIVPGTGVQNPDDVAGYTENAISYYVAPTTNDCGSVCIPVPVPYIAQWWPFPMDGWGGLKGAKLNDSVASGVTQLTSDLVGPYDPSIEPVYVFGYSQGTKVSSVVKSDLSKLPAQDQENLSFTLLSNLNRPNGGLLERFAALGTVPIFDVTFGQPTVTNTGMATTDISFQYDGISDFPRYPVNALAVLNALAGAWLVHPDLLSPNARHPEGLPGGLTRTELEAAMADPANRQQYGDTLYISIPASHLPLLQPIRDFGTWTHTQWLTTPLTDLVEPALKVLIETGYDRTLSYGAPAPVRLIPRSNPIKVTVDFVKAVGQGVQAALNDITGKAPTPGASVSPATAPLVRRAAPTAAALRQVPSPAAGAKPRASAAGSGVSERAHRADVAKPAAARVKSGRAAA